MSEEKRRVLEMLESGKLTPEQAQRLLEALGEDDQQSGPVAQPPEEKAEAGPAVFSTPAPTLELPKDSFTREAEQAAVAAEQAAEQQAPAGQAEKEQPGAYARPKAWPPCESCPPPNPAFERYEYTVDPAGVENLDISWVSGPVEVRAWNGETVRVTEYARAVLPEGRRLLLQAAGGTLTIRWAQELVVFGIWLHTKHLIVELPHALAAGLGRVKCANVSGKTYLTGLCAQELVANSTSGRVELGNVTARSLAAKSISGAVRAVDFAAQNADFGSTSGPVEAWGSAEEVRLKSVSGPLRLALGQCPGAVALASTSGGITLTLPGEMGFSASFSSVSGRFSTDFQVEGELGGKQGRAVHGDGYAKLKLNTISGNMKLLKM